MKLSLNWVKEFTDVNVPVDELVQKIGAQLGEVESVTDLGEKYKGIVIAKVVECVKHANADKLHVCMIDDGGITKHVKRDSKGLVQVVCGAPNVREGLLVAWLPPGTTVPSTVEKDPFVLESREIRGEVSNGMLASASELGLSDDHSGILEITTDNKPGESFAAAVGLDDHIIDIENKMFTHRPDLFGELGLAREVAGILHKPFESPAWYRKKPATPTPMGKRLPLKVKNELPKLVPRFMAVVLEDVVVQPSPAWLQSYLMRVGVRPINNVVDITNYMMMLTAQPLHAYDYDKVRAQDGSSSTATLVARHPQKGEQIKLLSGKTVLPRPDAIMIATADKLVGIGGVMGGADTEVDEQTENIILECATFDMYSIRRTSMEHGLFSDAVTRFNKGQSPLQNDVVIAKAAEMIVDTCGPSVEFASGYTDLSSYKETAINNKGISISADFINERLGTSLTLKEIANFLQNVEFKILSVPADKKRLHVQAPFWRTDIEIPEDIVEEVGRLYGYDHLPLVLPERTIQPVERNDLLDFQNKLRDILSDAGANEVLGYTFVHGNLFDKVGQDPKNAYQLSNALSPDLQYYRQSLVPSLLERVHPNLKSDRVRGEDNEFALFEINPVHGKDLTDEHGLPIEDKRLGFVFAADDKTSSRKYMGGAYFMARLYAEQLFEEIGITPIFHSAKDHNPKQPISKAAIAPFDKERSAIIKTVDGTFLGEIGEYTAQVRRNLKLPQFTAGFELDVDALYRSAARTSLYTPIPRFPKVVQDVTLRINTETPYGELKQLLDAKLLELQSSQAFIMLGMPRIYQPEDDVHHKHITLRLWVSDYDKTLKAEAVNALLDSLAESAADSFGAERV